MFAPVAETMRRIDFSRREKVVETLEKLEILEKVKCPSSSIKPLIAVKKANGDERICLDMHLLGACQLDPNLI